MSAHLNDFQELRVPLDEKEKWTLPQRFTVPDNDKQWPQCTWGMKLGWTASSIRHTNAYKDHRHELEAIGFDFTIKNKFYRGDAQNQNNHV